MCSKTEGVPAHVEGVPSQKRAREASEEDVPACKPGKRAFASARDGQKWRIRCGERAVGIRNPIREIMDTIAGKENPNLPMISLAQGDPTAYAHLRPGEVMVGSVVNAVSAGTFHGYQPSQGNTACRAAIAEAFAVSGRPPLTPGDVFMAIGCSEALSHCVAAFAARGSNMLLPRPGFPLYDVLCAYHGVECRYYDLLPNRNWEIDIQGMMALADENTCAILVNNPSNPCGAVYSRAHLEEVLQAAEQAKLPVIADEVYAHMTFGKPYIPCAAVNPSVPVLSVCAVSKRWLAPGWRLGWLMVYDAGGVLASAGVHDTLLKLCQVSLGPSAPLQAALPAILHSTSADWYAEKLKALEASARCSAARCKGIPGLRLASDPQGAMYFMVQLEPGALRGIDDDVAFAGKLLEEESVAVLPGRCFSAPGYFRVVFAAPERVIDQAWNRIEAFCRRRVVDPSPESP
mmetsp:Transcript_22112/g.66459  ORF Transcript_22112/g.66459 Transcript_22112/m.66459 type:complete len:460 (-) Transcript_22112:77-1456(-)